MGCLLGAIGGELGLLGGLTAETLLTLKSIIEIDNTLSFSKKINSYFRLLRDFGDISKS